ncbi:helix-turn-helix transcriptional regulator [Vineibacter terrae]|uniref:helix-turn-helix transcriptional regulator n=1 Tax=Vineibacter terrae TaxID=2586908 RepID=UPI002E30BCB5|nr:helix-turn-helix transcriptional regulator [Vineibacter terrae]HEX2886207.1 helix-turn-helix transcriptional regulator [Vineibacter terrae]
MTASARHDVLDILGLIQDAALDPAAWPHVVAGMMRQFDGIAGVLVINSADADNGRSVVQNGVDPEYERRYFDYFACLDPVFAAHSQLEVGRPVCLSPLAPGGLFTDGEFYNDWFAAQGFYDGLGAVVYARGERRLWLSVARPENGLALDHMEGFARLLPFVTRALRVAERLGTLTDRQAALHDTLAAATHGVMLVDRQHRPVFVNPAAEALLRRGQPLRVRSGRLVACDVAVDTALQIALAAGRVCDLAVPRHGQRPLLLSVVPVGRRAADDAGLDASAAAMIVASDPDMRPWPRLEGFARLYGLTAAEAKVLAALLDGDGLEQAADRLGVGRATVKTHLNRILGKTSCSRQNELLRLIARTLPSLREQ